MLAYIIRRLLLLIPVLLIVGVVVFTLMHLTPGDPASVMLGRDATQEQEDALRERLGLNEPIPVLFINWFGSALRRGCISCCSIRQKCRVPRSMR